MDPSIVHRSVAMSKVMELAGRVAATNANVLITGESGSGKSLLAEYLHRMGSRQDKPFVTVSCANLPAELFESELFGHEAGAHTDAVQRRIGKFEVAADQIQAAPYGIATRKHDALGPAVKKAVSQLYADGTMKAILAKWGLSAFALTG